MMFGLTTSHGTLLCVDRAERRVVHRPPHLVEQHDLLLCPGVERPGFGLIGSDGSWRPLDIGLASPARATTPPDVALHVHGGLLSIRGSSGFFTAPPDGSTRLDSPDAHDWEAFGAISFTALADLIALSRSAWLRVGTRTTAS